MAKNQMNLTIPENEKEKFDTHLKWLMKFFNTTKKSIAIRSALYVFKDFSDYLLNEHQRLKEVIKRQKELDKRLF